MARKLSQRKAQAAWGRIEALGGHGVWESDMVVVSLADTGVTDDDLAVFHDFPFVQILDLSRTAITGVGLAHLAGAAALKELIAVDTRLSAPALAAFQRERPTVNVVTQAPAPNAVDPFTGEPHM